MDEYIKREALRDSVESIDWYSVYRGKLITGATSENALYKANDIYSAIDNAPAANVAPVQHGRWIEHKHFHHDHYIDSTYECSECKVEEPLISNYCPNCGAKMDEGADNG